MELWAKRRPINGKGFAYEWICNFDREEQMYYMIDQLNRNIYQECLITDFGKMVMYKEFNQNKVRKRVK